MSEYLELHYIVVKCSGFVTSFFGFDFAREESKLSPVTWCSRPCTGVAGSVLYCTVLSPGVAGPVPPDGVAGLVPPPGGGVRVAAQAKVYTAILSLK